MSERGSLPFASVVVPVRNGEETIADCLASLLRLDYPAECHEIVVVDNGSTDRTEEIVRRFPVRYVREARHGVAAARNAGVAESRGELIALTDADCVVSTSWLRELLSPFADATVSAVAGEIVAYPPTTAAERYVARRKPRWQDWVAHGRVPYFLLGNTAVRREVFSRIGEFDPELRGCTDVDFSLRFFAADLRVHHCRTAVVFHRHRPTVGGLFTQQMRGGRGRALLLRKHASQVRWSRNDELGAWKDLLDGVGVLANTAGRSLWTGSEGRERLAEAYLDLVRKLAQRIGFLRGMLALRLSR